MGAIGLPGDLSSQSRFVRAAFVRMHAQSEDSEQASVSQFYHILDAVAQQRGCCALEDGKFEITLYSSCCNADQGIYYYKTYENSALTAVSLFREDLEGPCAGQLCAGNGAARPVEQLSRCLQSAPADGKMK